MNKKKAGAVFVVLLTCGLIAQAFAQSLARAQSQVGKFAFL